MLFDMLGKSSTITKFINEVVVIGSAEHLYKLDDIGMVDFGEDGNLVVGELAQLGSVLELLDIHHFHGVMLMSLSVLGLVDVTILTLSNFL